MTIITTLVTRWTRICNHDDDGDDYDDYDDDKYHDYIYDNLKAKELVDFLSDVVQVAVDPPQDVQLGTQFKFTQDYGELSCIL